MQEHQPEARRRMNTFTWNLLTIFVINWYTIQEKEVCDIHLVNVYLITFMEWDPCGDIKFTFQLQRL